MAWMGLLCWLAPWVAWADVDQPGLREIENAHRNQPGHVPRLTKPPRLIHQVAPVFPESAQKDGRAGTVTLRITIDDEGYIQRADVLQSAGADLDDAALGAVCQFVFEPAEVDDIPAAITVDYRQTFTLAMQTREVTVEAPPVVDDGKPPEITTPVVADKPVNYRGIVRESGTKNALADAEITVIPESGESFSWITDAGGRFEGRGVPTGKHLVRVAHTGHEVFSTVEEFSDKELLEVRYFLPARSYNRYETVVRSTKASKEINRVTLRREEVSAVAGTFGDPLRAIENLPGMNRAPLVGGQLLVRGTSPRNTGVYIDGVQVPLLYHFGGLTSIVNAEFLETIEFYPGGFGARYGRATAGIVDVKTRSLQLSDCRGTAKVDMFDSGFFFGCPITLWGPEVNGDTPNPRRVTLGGAGRHSYVDAVIPLAVDLFFPPTMGTLTVAPIYSDYQLKLEYRPSLAHTFQLIGFGSDDLLKVLVSGQVDATPFGIQAHQQFHRIVARWDWRIGSRLTNTAQAFVGLDWTNVGVSTGGVNLNLGDTTRLFGFRNELKYTLADWLHLIAGIDYTVGATEFDSQLPTFAFALGPGGGGGGRALPPIAVDFPRVVGRSGGDGGRFQGLFQPIREQRTALNLAPYVEAEIEPVKGLKLIPGFRFDYYKYGIETRKFSPTPRLALRWEPISGSVLKASVGIYEQAPLSQEVSPNLGQPKLGLERARQFVVGFEQRLTPKINVAVNGFYTWRDNLIVPSARVLSIENGVVEFEKFNNNGSGRVMGVDFLLRHELTKSFYGWVAYTLSRSEVRSRTRNPWTLFTYDQTHILTLVGQYRLPWHLPFREWAVNGRLPRGKLWNTGWSILSGDVAISGRWRLVTGNPTTKFVSSYHDLDTDRFTGESGQRNDVRMPAFHQLDIRVDYKMAFDNFLATLYVDLTNVYNQKNIEAVSWDYRFRRAEGLALLPFLPIAGFTAEF